jgi:peptidoglycan/LPS O-acetylase OafA/YrhL
MHVTKSVDPAVGQRPAQRVPGRIKALDGLRGGGAVVVMVFHYLCLLHPEWVPGMVDAPVALADTPLFILWNGPFAVSVFFVLSGFVMAGAAERYHDALVANAVTRYLRLAVPVLASVLLAWALLTAMPDAVLSLAATMETPSPWLVYTHQGEIPSLAAAVFDGLVANFVRGASDFNNVLWVMQIELVGSLGLFGVYWLFAGRARLFALGAGGLAIIAFLPAAYLAFVLGAFLYEAHVRGLLRPERMPLPLLALAAGIVLGGPGPGSAERWGLPDLPDRLTIGVPHGFIPVLAATLIHYGVLGLP